MRNKVIAVLRDLYHDEARAKAVLLEIGCEPAHLPAFRAAGTFWSEVVLDLERGSVPDGVNQLLRAATRDFPGNSRAASLLSENGTDSEEISVLCLFSDPQRGSKIRIDREARMLAEIAESGSLKISFRHAVRLADLSRALLTERPRVLHFGGHGWPDGRLVLEDEHGSAAAIGAGQLAEMIKATAPRRLAAVVLNSCYTATDAAAFRGAADLVAGSVNAIADDCALAFARGFYTGIAHRLPVAKAFAIGSAESSLHGHDITGLHLTSFRDGPGGDW